MKKVPIFFGLAALMAAAWLFIRGQSKIDIRQTGDRGVPVAGEYLEVPPLPIGPSSYLKFGLNSTRLIWIKDEKEVATVETPPGYYFVSPALLARQFNKVFFLLYTAENDPKWHHALASFDLNTRKLEWQSFSPQELFSEVRLNESWWHRFHCQTGLVLINDPPRIQFGCSVRASPDRNDFYGEAKGLTGRIVEVTLDAQGGVKTDRPLKIISTSRLEGGHEYLGFDSGVYQARAAGWPLSDGSTIWASGNGPVDFSRGNYGCSLLRVKQGKIIDGYSLAPQGSMECWAMNYEYSSSAYVGSSHELNDFGAILRKDGVFEIFENGHLARGPVYSKKLGTLVNYGVPISFVTEGATYFFVRVSSDGSFIERIYHPEFFNLGGQLPADYSMTRSEIVGYLPAKGSRQVSLYNSGPLRHKYALFVRDQQIERDPQASRKAFQKAPEIDWGFTDHFFPTFSEVARAGFLWSKERLKDDPNCFLRFKPDQFEPIHEIDLLLSECRDRPTYQNLDLIPIYETRVKGSVTNERGALLVMVKQQDGRFTEVWRKHYSLARGFSDHPSFLSGKTPRILATLSFPEENQGKLLVLNALTGAVMQEMPFSGTPHFTWPIVVGDEILLTTAERKLIRFPLNHD